MDQRVAIWGVPDGAFGVRWDQQLRAMATLLEFRGVETQGNEILAASGDAFTLCHASHFQGDAYLVSPTNPVRNLTDYFGFRYASTHAGPTDAVLQGMSYDERLALTRKALDRIRQEIDAGRPVLISGAEQECGAGTLVVGYDPMGDVLCHVGDGKPYRWTPIRGVADGAPNDDFGVIDGRCRGTATPAFFGGRQANPAYLVGERAAFPLDEDRVEKILRLAIKMHRAPKEHVRGWGGVDYFFGAEAYEAWADELVSLDYPKDLAGPFKTNRVEEAHDWYAMGNMDTQVDQIVTGRAAAASFCRRTADLLGGIPGEVLNKAADAYEAEVDVARTAFAAFIPRFDGNDERREHWLSDPAKRATGAGAIRRMLELETAAVRSIAAAM